MIITNSDHAVLMNTADYFRTRFPQLNNGLIPTRLAAWWLTYYKLSPDAYPEVSHVNYGLMGYGEGVAVSFADFLEDFKDAYLSNFPNGVSPRDFVVAYIKKEREFCKQHKQEYYPEFLDYDFFGERRSDASRARHRKDWTWKNWERRLMPYQVAAQFGFLGNYTYTFVCMEDIDCRTSKDNYLAFYDERAGL